MTNIDYVSYIHTDSLFVKGFQWLKEMGVSDKWEKLDLEKQLTYIKSIAKEIEDYVNDRSFHETQKLHYNSQEDDFRIVFEQEKVAFSGLFKDKGMYATWTLENEGDWVDDMNVTGLEIIRSDSPEVVKPMIKEVLRMLLKDYKDSDIRKYITKCKKELKQYSPEEIAENKGINKTNVYIDGFKCKKKTPHHIKGVANFKYLLDKFGLKDEYEVPQNGNKAKIVYIQKNSFNVGCLSFLKWPKEFLDKGIYIDYDKMIHNNFIKKVENLLEVVGKEGLLNNNISIHSMFS